MAGPAFISNRLTMLWGAPLFSVRGKIGWPTFTFFVKVGMEKSAVAALVWEQGAEQRIGVMLSGRRAQCESMSGREAKMKIATQSA